MTFRAATPRALFAGAASLALLGTVAALAARLVPPDEGAVESLRQRRVRRVAAELERDAVRLREAAEVLQRSSDVAEVVDGGGAEVRASRLFDALGHGLPSGAGFGALFVDAAGRPVAWAGDGAPTPVAAVRGLAAEFNVTRFRVTVVSPRVSGGEPRGTLVVARTYPTGVAGGSLEALLAPAGGPYRTRLRARQAAGGERLVALAIEPSDAADELDDVSRARARPAAAAAAAGFAALAFLGSAPSLAVLGARAVLALGSPRGPGGAWAPLLPDVPEGLPLVLVATPADVFLSGLSLLLAVWLAPRGAARSLPARALAGLASLGAALVPGLVVRGIVERGVVLLSGLDILPGGVVDGLLRTGTLAAATAALLLAASLWAAAGMPRGRLGLGGAGLVVAAGTTWLGGAPLLLAGSTAGVLLVWALAALLEPPRPGIPLARLTAGVLAVAGAALLVGAGQAAGKVRRWDRLLEQAASAPAPDRQREAEEGPARWEERVGRRALGGWLPAGEATRTEDLARALWVRGAGPSFPGADHLLTVRDADGRVVSSFGLARPGEERGSSSFAVDLPIPGLAASFTRVTRAARPEVDPLLEAVARRDGAAPDAVRVAEYDAAGRPSGGGPREDLPHDLLVAAQRSGTARGIVAAGGQVERVLVKRSGAGFRAYATPAGAPAADLAAGVAAAEGALLVLLPLAIPRRRPGPEGPRRRFRLAALPATFRARLVGLLLLAGALPLAVGALAVRSVLEAHAEEESRRRALALLAEATRALPAEEEGLPDEFELNRAASVIGTDLLLYRDGALSAASRAVPVAAGLAGERLSTGVAVELADGRAEATARADAPFAAGLRAVEAATLLRRSPAVALAVVVPEDEGARTAVDGLVLLAVGGALAALLLGARAALTLSRPIDDVVAAADRLGAGLDPPPIERPRSPDLARLVDGFQEAAAKVRERTALLAREREAAVGLLANLTAAVVLFREADGAVVLANPQADRLIPGGALSDRLADGSWAPLAEVVSRAKGAPGPTETRVGVTREGSARVYRVVVAPLVGEDDRRAVLLLEDLTDFIRADRLGAWVEAARSVAHDVKNPLTPIRLSAERLLRHASRTGAPEDGPLLQPVRTILRQVGILTERIGRLGRFSDLSASEPRPLPRGELVALLDEVAGDFRAHPSVRLRVEADESLPVVPAEKDLLRDALTNFALNAVEALGERGGTVVLSARSVGPPHGRPGVRVACDDDGPGVPAAVLERLFDPTFSTKARGSGMGLAAARRAVERQGGTVFAEERAGGGLSIGFFLETG